MREAVRRMVWARSGNVCAFPDCGKRLVVDQTDEDPAAIVGELAHIVGRSEDNGPRCDQPVPGGDRDGEGNMLLLCREHHATVDRQVNTYTVERLVAMKATHEEWVRKTLRKQQPFVLPGRKGEVIHSTLLAVDQLPRHVFTLPCSLLERDIFGKIRFPRDREVLLPYIAREKKLIAFADLTEQQGPFADVTDDHGAAERHDVGDWLRDEHLTQWLVTLLNRTISKYALLLGLKFDKEHKRFYFPPEAAADGKPAPREVTYRPLNQAASRKQVAWNPVRKKTGEPKRHWIHLAAGLRLHRVSPEQWVLSIRPERRFTSDGLTPLSPKGTGRRSTSTKSRMYNHELLAEVQFWRSFLTRDQPRIILNLGAQKLVIDGQLLAADVEWPGVRDDVKPFANTNVEDDLFSMAAYADAISSSQDAELDDLELDDLAVLEEAAGVEDDALSDEDFEADAAVSGGTTKDGP